AVDYLLKPFHRERFIQSFHRAVERVRSGGEVQGEVKRLLEQLGKGGKHLERIMVKKGSRYFFVKVAEIVYIEADEKYIKLHTLAESFLVRDTMSRMEERLDGEMFARIHRSYIVNIDFIKEIQPWSHGDYVVILRNEEKLTLSRRYSDRLLQRF
ncbi:MAG: LytTR family transcriptional regulator, partial [bacterium]|nr:LytTR family transcriptional regulator [bacterium]